MGLSKNIFERFLYEAPEDDPPDVVSDTGPPDVPEDTGTDDGPPDMGDFGDDTSDTTDDASVDDAPPDMGSDMGDDDFGSLDDTDTGDNSDNGENKPDLRLDEKISNIMNRNLYNHYLSLITKVNAQLTSIRNNSDVLDILSEDTFGIVKELEKLDENMRMYIEDKFLNEDYSKNLLFYNECLNLFRLLNEIYDKSIRKGIKEHK